MCALVVVLAANGPRSHNIAPTRTLSRTAAQHGEVLHSRLPEVNAGPDNTHLCSSLMINGKSPSQQNVRNAICPSVPKTSWAFNRVDVADSNVRYRQCDAANSNVVTGICATRLKEIKESSALPQDWRKGHGALLLEGYKVRGWRLRVAVRHCGAAGHVNHLTLVIAPAGAARYRGGR